MKDSDVLVIGSGAAGLAAAVRAMDQGLNVRIIEKTAYWGGTSAISGGALWFPCNPQSTQDSRQAAEAYMKAYVGDDADLDQIALYLDRVPQTLDFLGRCGVHLKANMEYPDYRQDLPGAALGGRTMDPMPYDGKKLGGHFHSLRDQLAFMKVFGRISLSNPEGRLLTLRRKGWIKLLASMIAKYWLDLPWRLKTRRGARLTMGSSLVAPMGAALFKAGVDIHLRHELTAISRNDEGQLVTDITTPEGPIKLVSDSVILASGGYEHAEVLRHLYMAPGAIPDHSASPAGANIGQGLKAAQTLGADVRNTQNAWWAPAVRGPMGDDPNAVFVLFMERASPGSIILNKQGLRFANEAKSYNDFGLDMLADQQKTGASADVWLIFDSAFRKRYSVGPLMAGSIMPDKVLPKDWLGRVFYRDDSLSGLASQIGLPEDQVRQSVETFNAGAVEGRDPQFGRGENAYDRYFGDPSFANPNVAPLVQGPFYAMRIVLGDLGTNGGLRTTGDGAVLDRSGEPIAGLYAVGNVSASIMGASYPGAGGTLGPAISLGIAAADAAAKYSSINPFRGR